MHANEHISRIQNLRRVADSFLDKSLSCTKISDIKAFFELAQQANESADAIEDNVKLESCWTYVHFVRYFDYSSKYNSYLEFCVRNRFSPVSQEDLKTALSYRSADNQSDDTMSVTAVQ